MIEGWETPVSQDVRTCPAQLRAHQHIRAVVISSFGLAFSVCVVAVGGVLNVWWLKLGNIMLYIELTFTVINGSICIISLLLWARDRPAADIKPAFRSTSH